MYKELNEVLIDFQDKLGELKTASELIGKAKDAAVSSSSLAQQMQSGYSQLFKDIQSEVQAISNLKDKAADDLASAGARVEQIATQNFARIDKELRDGFDCMMAKIAHLIDEEALVLNDFEQKADNILHRIQDAVALNIGGIKSELVAGRDQSVDTAKSTEIVLAGSIKMGLADLKQTIENTLNDIKCTIAEEDKKIQKELADRRNQSADDAENLNSNLKQIYDNTRQNQADSDLRFRVKLDENKAEVKQQIEEERKIVTQRVELVESQVIGNIKRQFDAINREQQSLQKTFWIIGGILVVMVSVGLAKAFGFL